MKLMVWIVVLAIVVLMVVGIISRSRPQKITDEGFEFKARQPSLLRTGLREFQN